jgi:hypothetical protein
VWHRLARPGPPRPRLEALAGCLVVAYFLWWLYWLETDLNWRASRGVVVWAAVATPWLFAGVFGAVLWAGWREALPAASRRIQAACARGAVLGLLAWCVVGNVVMIALPPPRGEISLAATSLLLGCVFGGVILGARAAVRAEAQPPVEPAPPAPASTSSG